MPEENKPKPELTYTAARGQYKGYPMLILRSGENEKYPFQFGYQKAKRIVACLEDIKRFVVECEAAEAAKAKADEAAKTVVVK